MTVIYLDELFLLNFVVDYLLLLAAGRLSGEVLRRGWLALGAAIGAAYAAAANVPCFVLLPAPPPPSCRAWAFFSIPSASWGWRCWPCWRATAKAAASCG